MIGRTLSHYRISEQLGAGGMGVVYLAHDERLERDVAVKVLLPGTLANEDARKRFRREALTLSKLNHPNVAIIFAFDSEGETDFLVTEYVSGETLDAKLASGPLSWQEVAKMGIQLAEGLAAAHLQGIVHRDLKPANLRLTTEGRLKILDFGLAQLVHPEPDQARTASLGTTSEQITGTLPYMAPEQLRGEPLDARSDIWAAGAVMYELATGKKPFAETKVPMLIDAILNRPPEPLGKLNPQISPGLESVILKALEKDRAKRYQSSQELAADLERLTAGIAPLAGGWNRRRWWTAAAVAVLVAGLTAGGYFLGRRKPAAAPAPSAAGQVIHARRSIAVLGFKNLSGRPDTAWVSTALSEMLTTELAAGDTLLTISGENVARVKADLSLPEQDTLARDTLARVRDNLGSDFVVLGSYLNLGSSPDDSIRLDLRLQDAQAGETIAHVSEKGTLAELDSVITRAGAQLREKLGAGAVPVEEQPGVMAALPSNLKASRLYAEGLARLRIYDVLAARDLLLQAVAADPGHVPSLVALSSAWSSLGYDPKSREAAKRAMELSPGLPRAERLRVEGQYYEQSSDWEKAIAAYKALFDHAPDDLDYGLKLVNAQVSSGKTQDALDTIARLRALPSPQRNDLLIDMAECRAANAVSDFKRELALAEKVTEGARKQGARMLMGRALLEQCTAKRHLGDPKGAVAACRQAQEIASEAGDRFVVAMAMNNSANALYDQGDTGGARQAYEAAVRVYREIGNMHGLAGALDNIASIMGDQGDHAGARKLSEQALAIYRETGYLTGVGETLNNMGAELITQGDLAGAQKRFAEALSIWRQTGNESGSAIALTNLGDLRFQLADIKGATAAYEDARALFLKGEEKGQAAYPEVGLGDAYLAGGSLADATKSYELGLSSARSVNDKHESAFALSGLGEVALEAGDLQTARKNLEEAQGLRKELGEKEAELQNLVQLAQVSIAEGKSIDAEESARKAVPGVKSAYAGADAALAHAALAEALLGQEKAHEARREGAFAHKLAAATQLRQVQLQTQLVLARTEGAAGNLSAAIASLQEVEREAAKLGLIRIQLNARLALAEAEKLAGAERKIGKNAAPADTKARLHALESEARARGFARIADIAAQALQ